MIGDWRRTDEKGLLALVESVVAGDDVRAARST